VLTEADLGGGDGLADEGHEGSAEVSLWTTWVSPSAELRVKHCSPLKMPGTSP
jgi:hypothetical protein